MPTVTANPIVGKFRSVSVRSDRRVRGRDNDRRSSGRLTRPVFWIPNAISASLPLSGHTRVDPCRTTPDSGALLVSRGKFLGFLRPQLSAVFRRPPSAQHFLQNSCGVQFPFCVPKRLKRYNAAHMNRILEVRSDEGGITSPGTNRGSDHRVLF